MRGEITKGPRREREIETTQRERERERERKRGAARRKLWFIHGCWNTKAKQLLLLRG